MKPVKQSLFVLAATLAATVAQINLDLTNSAHASAATASTGVSTYQ